MTWMKIGGIATMLLFHLSILAQNSEISVRFANPSFDCDNKTYCVDVEFSSDSPSDTLYGANMRFYYNTEVLSFRDFSNFVTDYGASPVPEVSTGVASSGSSLFGFPAGEAAAWVNGGINLTNTTAGESIPQGAYTKFFEVCFDIIGNPETVDNFCPELVWDLEEDRDNGGFLPGNDGVVITLKNGSSSTLSDEIVEHLNWGYAGNGSAPYGDYTETVGGCITNDCIVCMVPNTPPPVKQP